MKTSDIGIKWECFKELDIRTVGVAPSANPMSLPKHAPEPMS